MCWAGQGRATDLRKLGRLAPGDRNCTSKKDQKFLAISLALRSLALLLAPFCPCASSASEARPSMAVSAPPASFVRVCVVDRSSVKGSVRLESKIKSAPRSSVIDQRKHPRQAEERRREIEQTLPQRVCGHRKDQQQRRAHRQHVGPRDQQEDLEQRALVDLPANEELCVCVCVFVCVCVCVCVCVRWEGGGGGEMGAREERSDEHTRCARRGAVES